MTRTSAIVVACAALACEGPSPPSADYDDSDLFTSGPSSGSAAAGSESDDDGSAPATRPETGWEGSTPEWSDDAEVRGAFGLDIDTGCVLTFSAEGESFPCDACDLAFTIQYRTLDDTCGFGVSTGLAELTVERGRVRFYGTDWGEATVGGGLLTWDGRTDSGSDPYSYGYYEYFGYMLY